MIKPHFFKLSSYTATTSGELKGLDALDAADFKGKHLLVVEDIYDTGNSMSKLLISLRAKEPATLKVAVALHKKVAVNLKHGYFADYIAFFIPEFFAIGFGLDYNQYLREIPHLCKIS